MDAEQTLTMLRPGALLGGRFRLAALIGSGGVGVVYRGVDETSGATVAVKLLQQVSPSALLRFEREAESLAGLEHSAVVRYVAHGTHDGLPYLVMEWLDGEPLDRVLERGPLAVEDAMVVARRLAEGLAAAHDAGLVHRDIKPGNVVLRGGRFQSATLVDFGLARLAVDRRDVTLTGTILGTPGYMAPELARGAPASPAVDVFAVGCVLFEMLTGRRAFDGQTPFEALARVLLEEPPRALSIRSELPEAVQPLLDRLLAKRVADRPADGAALVAILASWAASSQGHGEAMAPPRPTARSRRFLPAPPAIVWGALSDSDRWERITGAPRTRYTASEVTTEGGLVRTRVGTAELFAMPMEWVEVGEWVEGAWGWGERRFSEGPFVRMGLRFEVEPREHGAEVVVESYAELREGTVEGARDLVLGTFHRRMERYLDALGRTLAAGRFDTPDAAGPIELVSALVLGQKHDDLLHGRPASWGDDRGGLDRVYDAPVASELRERIHAFLAEASEEQLRFLRPYELARALALDRRQTLRALLEVAHGGALDLVWSLACPTCRSQASSKGALAAVAAHARCPACQVDFGVDLARNVELGLRKRGLDGELMAYCESSPAFRPHVIASLGVAPGVTRIEAVPLPAGRVRVRRVGAGGGETILHVGDVVPSGLRITVEPGRVGVVEESPSDASPGVHAGALRGFTLVSIENAESAAIEVTIERDGPAVPGVRAVEVVTLADFIALFAEELPAEGVALGVGGAVAVAFELCGVEGLCDAVGIERASALTRDALEAFAGAVRAHGGTVSSEAGTRALASFAEVDDARLAAREAIAAIDASGGSRDIAARAALAQGPMIARRHGDALVLFGKPVFEAQRAIEATARGDVTLGGS